MEELEESRLLQAPCGQGLFQRLLKFGNMLRTDHGIALPIHFPKFDITANEVDPVV